MMAPASAWSSDGTETGQSNDLIARVDRLCGEDAESGEARIDYIGEEQIRNKRPLRIPGFRRALFDDRPPEEQTCPEEGSVLKPMPRGRR